mmetsp:Transcript_52894/g.123807  ORF Transcript_52894/g.123807 Transcript_52894/m.123807 type:complete len:317 (+) Transcript_52894:63-1013(+)
MKRSVDDEDEAPDRPLRQRIGGGGFSNSAGDGANADLQLEAMLPAAGGSFGMNLPKSRGAGNFGNPAAGQAPAVSKVETTRLDFSKLSRDAQPNRTVPVSKDLVETLMTSAHRQILTEETGAEVEWSPETGEVLLRGSPEQVNKATRLVSRVTTHCIWGRSEQKVRRLLKPQMVESVICRLSPMNALRPAERILSGAAPFLVIGKDKQCDVVIVDQVVSRQHCIVELDQERGAVYAIDCSTNGTFLNGIRLPARDSGKVLLSHGDELLLKDPASGDMEFGYIVNLNELHVKAEVKLEAPRRLLTPEEMASSGRDFS